MPLSQMDDDQRKAAFAHMRGGGGWGGGRSSDSSDSSSTSYDQRVTMHNVDVGPTPADREAERVERSSRLSQQIERENEETKALLKEMGVWGGCARRGLHGRQGCRRGVRTSS
ncbi:MAG TPA: hypothetical protein DCZ95_19705 [Verrucomicrobia bacterium]|nr:MAG: hypothetical protein A2X46_10930 [Lentisphaerae bacterium GWF2_57_35]HBA86312.1 hypothetical protein [Verrucomicrobiota bacterium]